MSLAPVIANSKNINNKTSNNGNNKVGNNDNNENNNEDLKGPSDNDQNKLYGVYNKKSWWSWLQL